MTNENYESVGNNVIEELSLDKSSMDKINEEFDKSIEDLESASGETGEEVKEKVQVLKFNIDGKKEELTEEEINEVHNDTEEVELRSPLTNKECCAVSSDDDVYDVFDNIDAMFSDGSANYNVFNKLYDIAVRGVNINGVKQNVVLFTRGDGEVFTIFGKQLVSIGYIKDGELLAGDEGSMAPHYCNSNYVIKADGYAYRQVMDNGNLTYRMIPLQHEEYDCDLTDCKEPKYKNLTMLYTSEDAAYSAIDYTNDELNIVEVKVVEDDSVRWYEIITQEQLDGKDKGRYFFVNNFGVLELHAAIVDYDEKENMLFYSDNNLVKASCRFVWDVKSEKMVITCPNILKGIIDSNISKTALAIKNDPDKDGIVEVANEEEVAVEDKEDVPQEEKVYTLTNEDFINKTNAELKKYGVYIDAKGNVYPTESLDSKPKSTSERKVQMFMPEASAAYDAVEYQKSQRKAMKKKRKVWDALHKGDLKNIKVPRSMKSITKRAASLGSLIMFGFVFKGVWHLTLMMCGLGIIAGPVSWLLGIASSGYLAAGMKYDDLDDQEYYARGMDYPYYDRQYNMQNHYNNVMYGQSQQGYANNSKMDNRKSVWYKGR